MKVSFYLCIVEVYFKPPMPIEEYQRLGIEYQGYEKHTEVMLASSPEVAQRAMKTMVLKKIGQQKYRLLTLRISDPEPINDNELPAHDPVVN